jgi:hypothetical protein
MCRRPRAPAAALHEPEVIKMKTTTLALGVALLASTPFAFGSTPGERTHGPCFNVSIQNDRTNESTVRQNCDMNFSRTVQAGQYNRAETIQSGIVNDNKVRQYQYGSSRIPDRPRSEAQ